MLPVHFRNETTTQFMRKLKCTLYYSLGRNKRRRNENASKLTAAAPTVLIAASDGHKTFRGACCTIQTCAFIFSLMDKEKPVR